MVLPDTPLVGADWRAAHLDRPGLVTVDARKAEVIIYCQGGIRAAHAVLALTLAGIGRVSNHEGVLGEWSRQRMPSATEPATAPPEN